MTQAGAARGDGNCIKNLYIVGHASHGHIHTGSGREHPDDPMRCIDGFPHAGGWETDLAGFAALMCPDGVIWIYGCNFGAGDKGAHKVWRLAQIARRRVRAPTGKMSAGLDGGYPPPEGNADPAWQEGDPKTD
ncbi:MAG TPA: DUF4347 domain-containing protein, partial [Planctomycetota bacterium]|nr:DUF4347 domain-containing protein [Planctomycetota bacterium]